MSCRPRKGLASALWALIALALCACEAPPTEERALAAEAAGDWRGAAAAWRAALQEGATSLSEARTRLGLGQALARLGDPEARPTLEAALALADAGEEPGTAILARQQLARLALWQGRPDEALALLDRALVSLPRDFPPTSALELRLTRAAALWRRGDLAAAETGWTEARAQAARLGDAALTSKANEGLAGALRFRGQFRRAAALCPEIELWLRAQPNAEERSRGLANCAGIRGSSGDRAGALSLAGEAVAAADVSGSARAQVHARNALATQLIDAGAADAALPVALAAVERARAAHLGDVLDDALLYVALSQERLGRLDASREALEALAASPAPSAADLAEAHALRGRLALAGGDTEATIRHFSAAVAGVEDLRAAVTPEQLHDFFDVDRRAPYLGLVDLLSKRGAAGDAERALEIVGRLESRTFLESLRSGEADPGTPESADPGPPRALPTGDDAAFDVAALRARLPADVSVLEWLPRPDGLLLFWVTRERVRMVRTPAAGAEVEALAGDLIARLAGAAPNEAQLQGLAALLLEPVANQLDAMPPGQTLCVIPHGRLRLLPAEALPFRGQPLGARHAIFSAPSLPALLQLVERRPPEVSDGPLVIADAGGDLPGARVEAVRLSAGWPTVRVLLGSEARESVVRALLPRADPIHFGVHGYPAGPRQPGHLGLVADAVEDGRLTPAEVVRARVEGALVVLSACETSVGAPNATGELPDVLDRAFLHAGARAVISTRWPINDAVANAFNAAFYGQLHRVGALRAFHAAQRVLAAGGMGPPGAGGGGTSIAGAGPTRGLRPRGGALAPLDTRKPSYWAAFVFHGNPR